MKTIPPEAVKHLSKVDPVMKALIKRVGPLPARHEPNAWIALSSAIMGQQISTHAARAIRGRFAAIVPGRKYPLPLDVLEATDETLRACGLSGNKALSLRDLARHFEEKKIVPRRFPKMTDVEIIEVLIPVRGIGQWTAEMFLLFNLSRPDVFAADDLGLRNAIHKAYDLPAPPKPDEMRAIAAPWQPYRSIASYYLWRSLHNEPMK
jgi:DNA-3-methyladenine glycosylase II